MDTRLLLAVVLYVPRLVVLIAADFRSHDPVSTVKGYLCCEREREKFPSTVQSLYTQLLQTLCWERVTHLQVSFSDEAATSEHFRGVAMAPQHAQIKRKVVQVDAYFLLIRANM